MSQGDSLEYRQASISFYLTTVWDRFHGYCLSLQSSSQWVSMLNLGIGLFNLLPIKPLDGGYMLEILLSYRLSEEHYTPIVNALSVVLAMVIVFSLVAGFL